jgi:hypothetical protein
MKRHTNHLPLWHPRGEAFHGLPRQGEPLSVVECWLQRAIKTLACTPIYFSVLTALTIVAQFVVVPLLKG